ncbi:hypothetical protein C3Y87_05490 [Carbonactinospora thermoautotrophica]|uniref:hypothetical protein n=1 Tax=Carbonactinospora thermoautotrophica TaxID=1469144 RepID=UPI00226FFB2D|nr:hypothetical protein [Carbonactinospora thermoautotrophica]MCX9190874.1 hypothetical protein [Carbonactinospora thermoautotrophica]
MRGAVPAQRTGPPDEPHARPDFGELINQPPAGVLDLLKTRALLALRDHPDEGLRRLVRLSVQLDVTSPHLAEGAPDQDCPGCYGRRQLATCPVRQRFWELVREFADPPSSAPSVNES